MIYLIFHNFFYFDWFTLGDQERQAVISDDIEQIEIEVSSVSDIDVSSGQVRLDLPDHADFTLNGKTSSGTIACDFPLISKGINNNTINGTHGSGKHKINLTVSSGSIKIY